MAYPDLITGSGPIGTNTDIFNWWKGAFSAKDENEGFGASFEPLRTIFPNFPFNRGAFHSWVNSGYGYPPQGSGSPYYTFSEPGTGWNNKQASDWGTIKSLELALFGNVANGGSTGTNTLSKYVSGDRATMGVAKWSHHDMIYLRYAFRQFYSYGTCISKYVDNDISYPLVNAIISISPNRALPNYGGGPIDPYVSFTLMSSYTFTSVPSFSVTISYNRVAEPEFKYIGGTFSPNNSGQVIGTFTLPNLSVSGPSDQIDLHIQSISPTMITQGGNTIIINY